jgi:hypothetical protein
MTIGTQSGLSAELLERASYEDIPALDRCRLRAKNLMLFHRWTAAICDEITLQTVRNASRPHDLFPCAWTTNVSWCYRPRSS